MFGFGLDTGDCPKIISYIDNVKNLESNKSNLVYRLLHLINIDNIEAFKAEIERSSKIYNNQGFIYLLDQDQTIVSNTFISNIKIIKSQKNNITISGFVWHHPKGYHKALMMKLKNEIIEKKAWKNLQKDELQGWLVQALHSMNTTSVKENIKILIDGNEFHNLDEFYCTIGEEINGAGGYFGRNLHALEDCFNGDFGVKSISELTWRNHKRSKGLFKSKFDRIIEIFERYGVKISLM